MSTLSEQVKVPRSAHREDWLADIANEISEHVEGHVLEEEYRRRVEALTPAQKAVFGVYWFAHMNDGDGLFLYYCNSTGAMWREALEGMRIFGIHDLAEIIEDSAALFPPPGPPFDHDKRFELAEEIGRESIEEIEDRFWRSHREPGSSMEDRVAPVLEQYIEENLSEFFVNPDVEVPRPEDVVPESYKVVKDPSQEDLVTYVTDPMYKFVIQYMGLDMYERHIAPATEGQMIAYALRKYLLEMRGGGFYWFWDNPTGMCWPDVRKGLETIGAEKHLALFNETLAHFPDNSPPLDQMERQRLFEWDEAEDFWQPFTDRYPEIDESIEDLLKAYIELNPEQFYKDATD